MKKIRLKKVLKSLGIIPNICKFCAKDLEIEKLKNDCIEDYEYICNDCIKLYKNKFKKQIQRIDNDIIHIFLENYSCIKKEIMDIKYFDKRYILKSIIEINSKDILKEIMYNSNIISDKNNKNKNEEYKILMIYIPTTLKKYLERGNISKYICKCLKYEFEKIIVKMMGKMEKYITKISENDIEKDISYKIIIVDDVYTTGATMKKITQMINQNIMVDRLNDRKKFEYIFFSIAKD